MAPSTVDISRDGAAVLCRTFAVSSAPCVWLFHGELSDNEVVPVHAMMASRGDRGIAPPVLNLCTKLSLNMMVVTIT